MRRDSNINVSWLVAFDAAARHLNFTRAAAELGLSQGAVSIQIRKLETALGAALFERRGRHIVLTDEGHSYHPHVSEALDELFLTTSRLFTGSRRNVVTFSCYSPVFADRWIAPRIAGLMAEIPGVQIDITIDYQASGARGERDDLIFTSESYARPGFIPLVEERLIAVCAPSYFAEHGADWGRGRLIECIGPRDSWPGWRTATGAQLPLDGRLIRVYSMSAALRLAECGAGAALVARPFADAALATGALIDLLPGKSLQGNMHGLSLGQLSSARPITKLVAARLLREANREVPPFLAAASERQAKAGPHR